jgi:hypothetical protein
MKQAVNGAAKGDTKAIQQLINLFRIFEDQIRNEDDPRFAPTVMEIHFLESDGNGRPRVVEGSVKTDENGSLSGDLDLYRKTRT